MSFDIIIPAYNCSDKIEVILNSVLTQTYKNYRVIIVDDGSQDDTLETCNKFAEKYDNILVVHQENQGPGIARQTGFRHTTAEYILFFDSDDFVEPDLLHDINALLQEKKWDIIEFGFQKINSNNQKLKSLELKPETLESRCLEHYICQNNTTNYLCNKAFKREIISTDDFVKLYYSEDACFLANVFSKAESCRIIPEIYYNYVISSGSACGQKMSVKRLDILKADNYMMKLVKKQAPDVVPNMACFACAHAVKLYSGFYEDKKLTDKTAGVLKQHFNRYYDILKKSMKSGMAYASSGRKMAIKTFRVSPAIYLMLIKLRKCIMTWRNME